MRKINVRSPFYIDGNEEINPYYLPDPYFYYTATECGGATEIEVRSTTELAVGAGIKAQGYGDTCFEITGTATGTNELDVSFSYTTCDKCNGIPDYFYYAAELCAGGSPINVRSEAELTVGTIIKAENYSADCYTITGDGTENVNTVLSTFNNCTHCATGIDYKYYYANQCEGSETVIFRYPTTLPSNAKTFNLVGYGNKCFTLDSETTEESTIDVVTSYADCTSCVPVDPNNYYEATECGGATTINFKSSKTLATGSAVTLAGQGDTCFEVTGAGTVSSVDWTNEYVDCAACAEATTPYYYYYAQKCDLTGDIIVIADIHDIDYVRYRLFKVEGFDGSCFQILSETTQPETYYRTYDTCARCPDDTGYRYWSAEDCTTGERIEFRSLDSAGLFTGSVQIDGFSNCYKVRGEIFRANTNDWKGFYLKCADCYAYNAPPTLYDIKFLSSYNGTSLSGKSISALDSEFNCLPCSADSYTFTTPALKALSVPMNVGHQLYNADGSKNTTFSGSYVSVSVSNTEPEVATCNGGAIFFPVIYTFNNGVVTYAKIRTAADCFSLPTTSEKLNLECGATHYQAADAGRKTYNVTTYGVGDFDLVITGDEVPVKFTIRWGGEEVTTKYIGSDAYDAQLLANGVDISDIATSPTSNKSQTLTLDKTATYPSLVEIEVFSPLVNDSYTIKPVCPPVNVTDYDIFDPIVFDTDVSGNNAGPGTRYDILANVTNLYNQPAGSIYPCLLNYFGQSNYIRRYYKGNIYTSFLEFFNYDYASSVFPGQKQLSIFMGRGLWGYYSLSKPDTFINPTNAWKADISAFRNGEPSPLSGERKYVFFVMERGVDTNAESVQEYQKRLEFMDIITTNKNNFINQYGLKDLIDAGVLEVVYNVKYNQPPEYYGNLILDAMNDSGYNITC
jgi:hypothetical protein